MRRIKLSKYYETERYKTELLEIELFAKRRISFLEPYLAQIKPKRVLELGCGDGTLALKMRSLIDAQVFGVDLSEKAVELAKEKNIIAKKADLNLGIPFESNFFDLVISDQLLEHIHNTDLLISEGFRVLKKKGYIIIITPNLSFWLNRILFLFGIYPIFLEASTEVKTVGLGHFKRFILDKNAMGHIRVFNLPSLIDILELQGFRVKEKVGITLPFNSPWPLRPFYTILDNLMARRPSLARDIMVIAQKP